MGVLTFSGKMTDSRGLPVSGMAVKLKNSAGSVRDQDTTDASGNYEVAISSNNNPPDLYRCDPEALPPHWSDPGVVLSDWANYPNDRSVVADFNVPFVNNAPTLQAVGSRTFEENGGLQSVTRNIADADGDNLTVTKLSGPSWGSLIKLSNTQVRWDFQTDTPNDGTFSFRWRVDDGFGGTVEETFVVTITPENRAPVLTKPPDLTLAQNTGVYFFPLEFSEPDGDPVTLSKAQGPAFGTVNAVTGMRRYDTGEPSATQGAHLFGWRAEDDQNAEDIENHTVTILPGTAAGFYDTTD